MIHFPSFFSACRHKIICLAVIFTGCLSHSTAQTEPHWEDRIIYGAGFMGPNALPVPSLPKGRVENVNLLMVSGMAQFSPGDNTYQPNTYAYLTLVKDLVSFDYFMVPVEFFNMSDDIIAERNVFSAFKDDRWAIGDVYLNSNIQVLRSPKFHAMVRMGFKIPSSNLVGAARFTDSPGYNLDASFGSYLVQKEHSDLELFAMGGFYSYQTQGGNANYRQNDAFLFGLGLGWRFHEWQMDHTVRGYLGYFNLRDKPIVYRGSVTRDFGSFRLMAACQVGLHDLPYVSPEIGIGYLFPDIPLPKSLLASYGLDAKR